MTFSIKQSIANINLRLSNLKQLSSAQKNSTKGKKQSEQHKTNIVTNLQSKLATASLSFKDVLEIRTQVTYCNILVIIVLTSNFYIEYES